MKRFAAILLGALLGICMSGMQGCGSAPTTAVQQTGITVLVSAAVVATIQKGTEDQSIWTKRATTIVSVGAQLQALQDGTVATLPAITTALQPLIAKANLTPGERLEANSLILILSQLIEAQRRPGTPEESSIKMVLQTVVDAARLYVPVAPAG